MTLITGVTEGYLPETSRPFTFRLNCFATLPCSAAVTGGAKSSRHVAMPRKTAVVEERRRLMDMIVLLMMEDSELLRCWRSRGIEDVEMSRKRWRRLQEGSRSSHPLEKTRHGDIPQPGGKPRTEDRGHAYCPPSFTSNNEEHISLSHTHY